MSALRPLFAAAGVLLLIALVFLAVRGGDDTAVPTAGGTISPGETAEDDGTLDQPTTDVSPTDDATGPAPADSTSQRSDDTACGIACGNEGDTATTGTGTDDTTGTDTTGTDDTGTDDTTGTTGPDDTTGTEDPDGTDGGETTGTGGSQPSDDTACGIACGDEGDTGATTDTGTTDTGTTDTGTATTTGTGNVSVDDMPDTGGGAASILGGLVALGASAGFARRR